MKRCSTSLAMRKIQIKTTMRYHLTPDRMTIINKNEILTANRTLIFNPIKSLNLYFDDYFKQLFTLFSITYVAV